MPKSDSLQGSLDLLVLKILSRRGRLHGYAILSAIRDISADMLRVEEGSLTRRCRREIGIRMAIGARPGEIVRGVTAGALARVCGGVIASLGTGLVCVRYVESLIYQAD